MRRYHKKSVYSLASVVLFGAWLFTAQAQAQDPKATLRRVQASVKPVLAGLLPAPAMEIPQPGQSFEVGYRTQKFLVHGRFMTGEWSTNASETVGPSPKGFLLRVDLQRSGEVNQAVTPQTLHEPYWQTFLEVTPVAGTTNQIYWALSYGDHADEKVLAALKQALGRLATNPGASQRKAP